MPYYNYIFLMITGLLVAYFIRYQLIRRKNSPFQLYNEALQNENKGNYKAALMNYEQALVEADKIRFYHNLKNRIQEKRKLLHTIIEYENNTYMIRSNENGTHEKSNGFADKSVK